MGVLDKIKKWLTKKPDKKLKEANRISNYGGRGTSNSTAVEVRQSIAKAEKAAKQKQSSSSTTTTKSAPAKSSAFKSTPQGVKRAEQQDARRTATGTKSSAFKATPPTIRHQSTALGTMSERDENRYKARRAVYEANQKEKSRAADKLKPLIDAKYSTRKGGVPAYIKQGNYAADPLVAKYNVLKHPIATSAARGGTSALTFGTSELATKVFAKGEQKEAEKFYQANKSKGAELAGELIGSVGMYGLTGAMSKGAVSKAAPKLTARLGETATARIAGSELVKNAARKEALAVLGREATEKEVANFARARAAKLVAAFGEDAAVNLTTGAVDDISRSIVDSDNPAEFAKNLGANILFNWGLGAVVPIANLLKGGASSGIGRVAADDLASRAARNLDNSAERVDIRNMARKPEAPKIEVEPKIKAEANAELKADIKAAEPKAEAPKNEITVKGEQAKTGERTEFRRDNAETAKEQARNKRATNSREPATQELFDKDFSAFEKKINKAQELRNKIRSASGEEKEALQKQLDKLNDEIKSARNQASLRYHPDRGGSDEWMGKFNDTYKDYRRGSYSSKGFKSAESSTRAKTATGGGGNTTPPRRAKTATGDGNFKKPRGKTKKAQRTVYNVEDVVNKKQSKVSNREKLKKGGEAARRKFVNSMATFEKTNLKNAKEALKKAGSDKDAKKKIWGTWEAKNAAINKHRTYQGYAATSIKDAQLKANNRRYSGTIERVGADGKTYQIENGKSLKRIYDEIGKENETAFDAYLLLKHAPDRIREGTPIFDRIKLASNESLNDVKVINREADRILKEHPEFAQKAEEIYQYTQNELQNRVENGLLSQETASKWMHDHPFYVPTQRDGYFSAVHGNHKGIVGADPLKATKGSDLDIRSIKEQLAEATRRNWRDITANNLLEKTFGDRVQTGLTVDNGLELLNDTVGLSKSADGQKYYAKIFRNGDMHRVEIDKAFYDDLQDLYKNGSVGEIADAAAHAFSLPSRLFKNAITTWNPIFMGNNFARDSWDALINTRQSKEFLQCYFPAIKQLATDGEYLQALRDAGVSQSNFIDLEKSLIKSESKFKILGIAKKGLNKFATFQEAIETLPRLAEFMATIKKAGYKSLDDIPPEKYTDLLDIAAANASDITVNFDRGGSISKNLNKGLVPFFGPSVQGSSKFVRNFTEQPGLRPLLGTIGKGLALGAGVTAINNYLLEDNPNYQKISARDKATNIIIAMPYVDEKGQLHLINNETDTFIKIPKGRFAVVYGLSTINTNNKNKMGYAEMFKVIGDSIAPVDPIESNILSPFVAARDNKTWYGAPIVPANLVNENNPSEEYDENTSPLGMALGKATSGLIKELQISPKRADYVIDATTGVFGDFGLPASKALAKGESVGDAALGVVKKAFTIDSVTRNDLATRFYDNMQKAEENLKSSNAGEAEQAEYDRYNSYRTEISGLNKAIRQLQNDNLKMNKDSIRELQKIRNEMTQDALDGKEAPSSTKTMDAVQKYVGTTYAVDNFGSTADQEAMKIYGKSKYGDISDAAMKKKMDADGDFYKGVKSIHDVDDKMTEANITSNTGLTKAVALASVDASEELFTAYGCTNQSRTESANKMERAKTYLKDGGSVDEYVKIEKTLKTVSRYSSDEKDAEIEALDEKLAKGEITDDEYQSRADELGYNPNTSYIGKATSLAQANCPERGYRLYDIKDKNIQKGINLAAMGFTARDYREMAKAVDTDGNGYPKKQEIIDYVSNSNIEDKATLYDILYYYQGKYNPFGTPTKYTRAQAADAGKAKGVEWITDERDDIEVNPEESSGSWRGGYYRYGRWHRWGGYSRKGRGATMDKAAFAAKTIRTSAEANAKSKASSAGKQTYKSLAESLTPRGGKSGSVSNNPRANYNTSAVKYQTAKAVKSAPKNKTTAKKTPPKVKFKKYEV